MSSQCTKCKSKENYNFAINNGLCNSCIEAKLDKLEAENERLQETLKVVVKDEYHNWQKAMEGILKVEYYIDENNKLKSDFLKAVAGRVQAENDLLVANGEIAALREENKRLNRWPDYFAWEREFKKVDGKVKRLQTELAEADEMLAAAIGKYESEATRLIAEQEKNKRLKEFARHVIRQECWSIFDIDGGDIQELAEKLGLIVPQVVAEKDVDDESDYGVGDTIFVFSDTLKETE